MTRLLRERLNRLYDQLAAMTEEQDSARIRAEQKRVRQALRREFGAFYDELVALLAKHDPIGIVFGDLNADEYDAEVRTILPRLKDADSATQLCRIIHEEFVGWFDLQIAGPESKYAELAAEAWTAWRT